MGKVCIQYFVNISTHLPCMVNFVEGCISDDVRLSSDWWSVCMLLSLALACGKHRLR